MAMNIFYCFVTSLPDCFSMKFVPVREAFEMSHSKILLANQERPRQETIMIILGFLNLRNVLWVHEITVVLSRKTSLVLSIICKLDYLQISNLLGL